jgi:hypothetical protein
MRGSYMKVVSGAVCFEIALDRYILWELIPIP